MTPSGQFCTAWYTQTAKKSKVETSRASYQCIVLDKESEMYTLLCLGFYGKKNLLAWLWASSAPLSIFLYQKFWLVSKFTWLLLGSVLNHGKSHTVLWSDFLYCRQLIAYADNINSKTALRTLRGCIDTLNTCFRNDDKVRERTKLLLLIASKKRVY